MAERRCPQQRTVKHSSGTREEAGPTEERLSLGDEWVVCQAGCILLELLELRRGTRWAQEAGRQA